jgi:indole-3-glycerol phosphate synthase
MDQIKDRIKLVDTTLLSLEQVYTTLSHVSLKNMPFFVPTSYVPKEIKMILEVSYFIVGVHSRDLTSILIKYQYTYQVYNYT